jgi:hypothetical protein
VMCARSLAPSSRFPQQSTNAGTAGTRDIAVRGAFQRHPCIIPARYTRSYLAFAGAYASRHAIHRRGHSGADQQHGALGLTYVNAKDDPRQKTGIHVRAVPRRSAELRCDATRYSVPGS